MYLSVKRLMTAVFVVFLAVMFTLPRAYLDRSCDELLALAKRAESAPEPALSELSSLYGEKSRVFRLFLDHAAVDAVGAAVAAAEPLREKEALESALSVLKAAVESLRRIEVFGWEGLA